MVIDDNKIQELGNNTEDSDLPHFDLERDFGSAVILPGLHDGHIHAFSLGRSIFRLQLDKPKSISEMQSRLKDYLPTIKSRDQWIVGFNWDQDYMEDKRYPTKEDIDLIEPDQPVVLFRACHHIGLVNTKGLELLGIDSNYHAPDGGAIDLDDNGEPTGILRETALSLVTPFIDIKDPELRLSIFKKGLEECVKSGLTSIHTNDPKAFPIYKKLAENDELPVRVFLTIYHQEIDTEFDPPRDYYHPLLRRSRVKLFADGSLGARTATLREQYQDGNTKGIEIHSQDVLDQMVSEAITANLQLEIHGIGDRAAEQIIHAFQNNNLKTEDRPVFTHCQVLAPDLISRMQSLGIIANIQPPFVKTDSQWAEDRLGSERIKYSYAWKTLIENGITVVGGSDAPIEDHSPLIGIHAAIFRYNTKRETWRSNECLSFEEALKIYTINASYALNLEDKLGQLNSGYLADFTIINDDVISHPEKLENAQVLSVWVNGKETYYS